MAILFFLFPAIFPVVATCVSLRTAKHISLWGSCIYVRMYCFYVFRPPNSLYYVLKCSWEICDKLVRYSLWTFYNFPLQEICDNLYQYLGRDFTRTYYQKRQAAPQHVASLFWTLGSVGGLPHIFGMLRSPRKSPLKHVWKLQFFF